MDLFHYGKLQRLCSKCVLDKLHLIFLLVLPTRVDKKDETPDPALLNQLRDGPGAEIWGQLDSFCSAGCKDRQWEIPVPVGEVPGGVQQEKS